MFALIKKWFKKEKKPLIMLGRGGLKYYDGKEEYYIDSDNMGNDQREIIIYYKGIKPCNGNIILSIKRRKP